MAIRIRPEDEQRLREVSRRTRLTQDELVSCAIEFSDEMFTAPTRDSEPPGAPPWWGALCQHLRQLQKRKAPLLTRNDGGVPNHVVQVSEKEGYLVLRSDHSRRGRERRVSLRDLALTTAATTTHGVIRRRLRHLGHELMSRRAVPGAWAGPFRLGELLLDAAGVRPPERCGVYLVTRHPWSGAPSHEALPLYVGGNTGVSARFRTRVGDLLIDALGFYGGGTGHSSGGQHLHEWCATSGTAATDLYVGWYTETPWCDRCVEVRLHAELRPRLNRRSPPRCQLH